MLGDCVLDGGRMKTSDDDVAKSSFRERNRWRWRASSAMTPVRGVGIDFSHAATEISSMPKRQIHRSW